MTTIRFVWAVGVLAATVGLTHAAPTAPTPFDFTGHWTGTLQESGKPAAPLSADLTGSTAAPHKISGSMMITTGDGVLQCSITGVAGGKGLTKITLHLHCSTGGNATARGKLDTTLGTITGSATVHGKHRIKHDHFTLVKA